MKLSLMMLLLAALAAESFCAKVIVKYKPNNKGRVKSALKAKAKGVNARDLELFSMMVLEDMTKEEALKLPGVDWVEDDMIVSIAGRNKNKRPKPTTAPPPTTTTAPPPLSTTAPPTTNCIDLAHPGNWNADRCDQREKLSYTDTDADDSTYKCHPATDGAGVRVAVLDTGIDLTHPEFENVEIIVGYVGYVHDGHGHGTHVAGTIASAKHGIAKNATLLIYKVLDDNGSGTTEGIIYGMETAMLNGAHIISMSLGWGQISQSFNEAVEKAVALGVTVVVAAGNSAADACSYSPSSASSTITVGATDISDNLATYSNYGSCVDILAPGSRILSTFPGNALAVMSGTSMATPAVSAAAALVIGNFLPTRLTPANVKTKLIEVSSKTMVNIPRKKDKTTPNRLLYIPCNWSTGHD